MKAKVVIVLVGLLSLVLTGCPERDGPAEQAGEAVDRAVDDAKDAVD
jgi:hypothetical protein